MTKLSDTEGIGAAYSAKLEQAGVNSLENLLESCYKKNEFGGSCFSHIMLGGIACYNSTNNTKHTSEPHQNFQYAWMQ